MTQKTRDAFDAALAAHTVARQEAALSGQDPADVDAAAVLAAARAHLAGYDPDYEDRNTGLEPHARIPAPDLKAAYEDALGAFHADPGDAGKAAKANELGGEYQAVREAARIVDTEHGRAWGFGGAQGGE